MAGRLDPGCSACVAKAVRLAASAGKVGTVLREEITEKLRAFEASHDVSRYRVYDWNAWPPLRIWLAFACYAQHRRSWADPPREAPEPAPLNWKGKALSVFPLSLLYGSWVHRRKTREARRALEKVLELDASHNAPPDMPGTSVVVLTVSNRRVEWDGGWYEVYSGPLTEILEARGITHVVWEDLEEVWPRTHATAWISRRLQLERQRQRAPASGEPPAWFSECAGWAERELGVSFTWKQVQSRISVIEQNSRILGRWLERTGARCLFVVSWYDRLPMAATLAAWRLGVTRVDLQHGTQDAGHFAYSGWSAGPDEGYELVPDCFWTWGRAYADALMANNPAWRQSCRALVGGNLWVNKWRCAEDEPIRRQHQAARDLSAGHERTVLVTLQVGIDLLDPLCAGISGSPQDWLWLIRFHPRSSSEERAQTRRRLESTRHPGLEFTNANKLALYALFRFADAQVTGYSTSALEALAFGTPSVIVHPSGHTAFREQIESGVMFYAETPDMVSAALRRAFQVPDARCLSAAEPLFASPEAAERALADLLRAEGAGERNGA